MRILFYLMLALLSGVSQALGDGSQLALNEKFDSNLDKLGVLGDIERQINMAAIYLAPLGASHAVYKNKDKIVLGYYIETVSALEVEFHACDTGDIIKVKMSELEQTEEDCKNLPSPKYPDISVMKWDVTEKGDAYRVTFASMEAGAEVSSTRTVSCVDTPPGLLQAAILGGKGQVATEYKGVAWGDSAALKNSKAIAERAGIPIIMAAEGLLSNSKGCLAASDFWVTLVGETAIQTTANKNIAVAKWVVMDQDPRRFVAGTR